MSEINSRELSYFEGFQCVLFSSTMGPQSVKFAKVVTVSDLCTKLDYGKELLLAFHNWAWVAVQQHSLSLLECEGLDKDALPNNIAKMSTVYHCANKLPECGDFFEFVERRWGALQSDMAAVIRQRQPFGHSVLTGLLPEK